MENKSWNMRKYVTTDDGNFIDINNPAVNLDELGALFETMHFVQDGEEMRLDKIANNYYGWSDNIDAILWANNIYNPFSIEAKDIIIIPKVKDIDSYLHKPKDVTLPDSEDASTGSRITNAAKTMNQSTEDTKMERMRARAKEFGGGDVRATNTLGEGERSKHAEGYNIILGE